MKSIKNKNPHTYTIEIPVSEGIFGTKGNLSVAFEDIMHMAKLEEIGATCIAVYIR